MRTDLAPTQRRLYPLPSRRRSREHTPDVGAVMLEADSPTPGGRQPERRAPRRGAGLLAVGAGNVAILVLGLVSGVIASRVLGPALRGEFVAAQTWAGTCALLLTLGVGQAVVTYRGENRQLTGPLLLQAAGALIFGVVLFIVLSASGQLRWLTAGGIVGGAALVTAAVVSSASAGYAQRLGRMTGAFQSVRLLPQAVGVVAIVAVWRIGSRDPNYWLLGVGLAVFVPSVLLMVPLLGGLRAIRRIDQVWPSSDLVRGVGSAFVIVIGSQLIYRLDSLLVAVYLPPYEIALYAVAVTAAGACAAVGQAVGMLTFSRMRGMDDPQTQRSIIRSGTARALAVTAAAAVPLAVVAPWAIRVVYGSAFVPASGATRLLVLAAIPLAADYLLVHALLSSSASRGAFKVQLLAAVLTVGLLAAAISNGSLVLIALVSTGVYSVSATLLFVTALRHTRPAGR